MTDFWSALDTLVAQSELIIDRPRGSAHPRYPDTIYPMDYGYLGGTSSSDGESIDVWLGSDGSRRVVGVICTVDLVKRDSEIKILLGCTDGEISLVNARHNEHESMKGLLIRR